MQSKRSITPGYGTNFVPSNPSVAHFDHADHFDFADFDAVKSVRPRKILKYTGSKDRLLPQLNKLANYAAKNYDLNSYKEFCGGSCIFRGFWTLNPESRGQSFRKVLDSESGNSWTLSVRPCGITLN